MKRPLGTRGITTLIICSLLLGSATPSFAMFPSAVDTEGLLESLLPPHPNGFDDLEAQAESEALVPLTGERANRSIWDLNRVEELPRSCRRLHVPWQTHTVIMCAMSVTGLALLLTIFHSMQADTLKPWDEKVKRDGEWTRKSTCVACDLATNEVNQDISAEMLALGSPLTLFMDAIGVPSLIQLHKIFKRRVSHRTATYSAGFVSAADLATTVGNLFYFYKLFNVRYDLIERGHQEGYVFFHHLFHLMLAKLIVSIGHFTYGLIALPDILSEFEPPTKVLRLIREIEKNPLKLKDEDIAAVRTIIYKSPISREDRELIGGTVYSRGNTRKTIHTILNGAPLTQDTGHLIQALVNTTRKIGKLTDFEYTQMLDVLTIKMAPKAKKVLWHEVHTQIQGGLPLLLPVIEMALPENQNLVDGHGAEVGAEMGNDETEVNLQRDGF